MSRSLRSCFALSVPMLLAVGCYTDDTDPAHDEFRSSTSVACGSCTNGGNSPSVDDFEFPELNLDGEPNADDIVLLGIVNLEDELVPVRVDHEEFVALSNGVEVIGGELLGYKLRLSAPTGVFDIEITAHDDEIHSLAAPGADISAYGLRYASLSQPSGKDSVCPGYDDDDAVVTLIHGETYDRDSKTIAIRDDEEWFTLACADEAAYKMKRMNYGPNAEFRGSTEPASPEQREATLKMITADYCGDGFSFTAQGTPVFWQDAAETVGPGLPPSNALLEAYWTAAGALCLDTPRLVDKSEVAAECSLPGCDQIDLSQHEVVWATYAYAP